MQSFSRVAYTDRMRSPAILALILALLIAVGSPAAALEGLREGERGRVVEVIDADTVILDSGLSVRLVGIQAPKLPLGREGFVAWPLAAEAKAALEEMVLEQSVGLFYGGLETDRYGRALAHLVRDDGLWLQGELLARGWARVYGFRDNRAKLSEMLALEAEARAEKRGIWAEPFYRVGRSTRRKRIWGVSSWSRAVCSTWRWSRVGAISTSGPTGGPISRSRLHPRTCAPSRPRASTSQASKAVSSACGVG